jgi:predicted nucleotidyltransferase
LSTRPQFTSFAASRFLDRDAVLAALDRSAARAGADCPNVVAIYLFGSFVNGTPTPRSDADLLVLTTDDAEPTRVYDCCSSAFLDSPVPVDLFVQTCSQAAATCAAGRGVAATALRDGLLLYTNDRPTVATSGS